MLKNPNVGDLVILNGGGPIMTIASISDDKIWCSWFKVAKLNKSSFTHDMLYAAPKKTEEK